MSRVILLKNVLYMNDILTFSVIIPCYNSVELLERGINSLLKQAFRNFEVVFVDDCSTDGTYDYLLNCKSESALNIQVLRNEKNCGPGESRNLGIREAKGEYIAFMDSDDWYEEDFLQQMYERIQETEAELVLCDFYRCFVNGQKQWMKCTRQFSGATRQVEFVALCFDSLCALIAKKSLFQKIMIPAIYNAEDAAIVPVLVSRAKKVAFVGKPFYNYLYRSASLSTKNDLNIVSALKEAACFLRENINSQFQSECEFRCIQIVMYAIVFKALQGKMKQRLLRKIIDEYEIQNKLWYKNKYIRFLPLRKRVFLKCVRFRLFLLLKWYVDIQDYWLNKGHT